MDNENCHDNDSCKSELEILSQWKVRYEEPLNKALSENLETVFANLGKDTWAEIRKILAIETEKAVSILSSDIYVLELDVAKSNKMKQDLRDYARNLVETKAREEAENVLLKMKIRFAVILTDSIMKKKDKKTVLTDAYSECLKLLSVMAAMRLDEKLDKLESKFVSSWKEKLDRKTSNKLSSYCKEKLDKTEKKLISFRNERNDQIKNLLFSSLMDKKGKASNLATSTWLEVSPKDTLITPVKCKLLWESFQADIVSLIIAFDAGQAALKSAAKALFASTVGVGVSAAGIFAA
ncbi:Root hair defective 3 GTP-binding protein [Corchorus olitorius]|uniref:Root hair defective 3 GTP-binding protein n=1 Tax=Corchorus olitorius TaxID=93759 RepID=A0A1R3JPQ0_9ROSI|nr:Root hair defective 3 GTP-binding protein [Corchorus olitorius]